MSVDHLKHIAADIPDADHIWEGPDGMMWFRFVIDFQTPDGTMSADLWAHDWIHAQRQLDCLKRNAILAGQAYRTLDD